jgi:hypothetical protein
MKGDMTGDPTGPPDMRKFRSMYVVVCSLPTIIGLMTFVLWFMATSGSAEPTVASGVVDPVIFGVLTALSVPALPIALLVRRLALKAVGPYRNQYGTFEGEAAAIGRITTAATVGMAIPEIPVLMGFVLCFSGASWLTYALFCAYALVGWIVMFPRPSQVREWYSRQTQSAPPIPQPL